MSPAKFNFRLEQEALGEGDKRERSERERSLLLRSNQEILNRYPTERMVPELERRVRALKPKPSLVRERARQGLTWGMSLATAAMVSWGVFALFPREEMRTSGDEIRLKGMESHLQLYRKTADGSEPLKPGQVVRPGDVLQPSYVAGGARYGAVLSIDGRGQVSLHWPLTPGWMTPPPSSAS